MKNLYNIRIHRSLFLTQLRWVTTLWSGHPSGTLFFSTHPFILLQIQHPSPLLSLQQIEREKKQKTIPWWPYWRRSRSGGEHSDSLMKRCLLAVFYLFCNDWLFPRPLFKVAAPALFKMGKLCSFLFFSSSEAYL